MSDGICLKTIGDSLYLRGGGSLNARNCEDFKNTVHRLINSGIKTVHIDLKSCTYMDSTFLGLLVGVHKKVRQSGGDGVTIYEPSSSALEHLEAMGIDKIIRIASVARTFPESMDECPSCPTSNPEEILSAHRHLMELSAENRKRFKILAQVLEQQIRRHHAE